MLQWLRGLLNFFGGGLALLWNTFLSVISSVYSSLADDDNRIIAFANSIYIGLWRLNLAYGSFTTQAYPSFVRWVEGWIARLQQQEEQDFQQLIGDINALSRRTQQNITYVQQQEGLSLSALIKWIISTIFNPLKDLIGTALGWIEKEGAWLIDLLTHLEKLADLIMAFLWQGWLVLLRKYMKQVVVFIFSHWKSWIPAVLPIVEDILTSVL